MKNKLILRMFIILIITVLVVTASVYTMVYFMSQDAILRDIRQRAIGVKDYFIQNIDSSYILDVSAQNERSVYASAHIQRILNGLRGIGNFERLYIAVLDEAGDLVLTMNTTRSGEINYIPTGRIEADLRQSLARGEAIIGNSVYNTDDGNVYTMFWPILNGNGVSVGTVGMEFNADIIFESHRQAMFFSLSLSGVIIVVFSILAYLSMSSVTEPLYKKLAYKDILTDYENRMAFEHRLRECDELALRGKSVTLIVFDINDLKLINDTQGHKAGDAYLKRTADYIFDNLRGLGSFFRIGGDEFAALIVGKREKEIQKVLDALDEEKRYVIKKQPFNCAFGTATYIKGMDKTMRDVFKRADVAMYEKKKKQKADIVEKHTVQAATVV